MNHPAWQYQGVIDCFGLEPQQRDVLLSAWMQHAADCGGEMEISAKENQFDTDRYELRALWPSGAEPFVDWAARLARMLPAEHVMMTISGYFPANMEREDIIVDGNEVSVIPYIFTAGPAVAYDISQVEDLPTAA